MTNRERVLAALRHEQPDRTPYCIGFTYHAHAKMQAYYGDADFAAKLGNCLAQTSIGPARAWTEVAPDIWEDAFGVQWNRTIDKDIGNVCNQVVTRENLADYQFPSLDDPPSDGHLDALIGAHPDKFTVGEIGFSLFERAWTLTGMENLLMAMMDDPDFAHGLLDRILEFNLRAIARGCRHGLDGIYFGDDWGSQTSVLMGPELWREYIKPRIAQMYAAVKRQGKFVFIHSCGKVDELFPELIDLGLDVFNPFQPEVIDVYAAKRTVGDRLSFFGGISTQRTLPYGTPEDTRAEVRRLIAEVGKNGGYIAAPAHAIPGDAKPENIAAMIEVLQGQ